MKQLVSILLLAALAACASPPPPAPSPTPPPAATFTPSPSPSPSSTPTPPPTATIRPSATQTALPSPTPHPLTIESLRQRAYPGSEIRMEEPLDPGANYTRQVVSYQSEGLTIYALLTVPNGAAPAAGWPAIVFNHGYIPPAEYHTTERYVAYVDALARNGFVVIKPDYRGHGSSQGQARGGYSVPDYTTDVLNALASIQRYPGVDPARVGMWGHSMGGMITLRSMVINPSLRAGVIWAGVVASYPDILYRWRPTATASPPPGSGSWRRSLVDVYGTPEENPAFWDAISPSSYLADLSGPLQLHHAKGDAEVPVAFSQSLYERAQAEDAPVSLYLYEGDNHNISANFSQAMQRTIAFFKENLR